MFTIQYDNGIGRVIILYTISEDEPRKWSAKDEDGKTIGTGALREVLEIAAKAVASRFFSFYP
jgi:hypothetical protein